MATISDVARLANVSGATVSHVINKSRKVNPETSARVEWAIHELDYRPNAQARCLKTGQSRLIGVLTLSSMDPYFSEVLSSLERAAHASGYGVMLRHSEWDQETQHEALESLADKNIDGLIVNSPIVSDDFYAQINKITCPCVLLHYYDPALAVDAIHSDDLGAADEATRYLIGLGHRRVACIAGFAYEQSSAFQRRRGYEKALTEAGLALRAEYFADSNYSPGEGYELFKNLCGLPEPPTAFITYSDLLALGALRAAADLGLSVPGDVSIIGFDDIELASFAVPRLTTVYQDKQHIGELAFAQVQKRILDPNLPLERIVLPTHLTVRESCGPAPGSRKA